MKNVQARRKLTLDRETVRHLRVIATAKLARVQGGNLVVVETGGACTETDCEGVAPR